MSYAIRKDGKGWRSVGSASDVGEDEAYSDAMPLPNTADANVAMQERIRVAIQTQHIDTVAQVQGFSNGNAMMLYAGFKNKFQAASVKFAQWEADVWVAAQAIRDQVLAGERPMPTVEEVLSELPQWGAA